MSLSRTSHKYASKADSVKEKKKSMLASQNNPASATHFNKEIVSKDPRDSIKV